LRPIRLESFIMGRLVFTEVQCGECGRALKESPNALVENRKPCPECGSLARRIDASISVTVETHSGLGLKHKRPGVKRALLEQKQGASFSTRLGRWMRRTMVVDRENNRYTEKVVDPTTGQTIHDCDEPLSDHQQRGSAKRPKS
jgi:hypothetical protein